MRKRLVLVLLFLSLLFGCSQSIRIRAFDGGVNSKYDEMSQFQMDTTAFEVSSTTIEFPDVTEVYKVEVFAYINSTYQLALVWEEPKEARNYVGLEYSYNTWSTNDTSRPARQYLTYKIKVEANGPKWRTTYLGKIDEDFERPTINLRVMYYNMERKLSYSKTSTLSFITRILKTDLALGWYGYDCINKDYFNANDLKQSRIINMVKFRNKFPYSTGIININQSSQINITGSTIKELSEKYSQEKRRGVNLNVNVTVPKVPVTFKAKFGTQRYSSSSHSTDSNTKEIYGLIEANVIRRREYVLDEYANPEFFKNNGLLFDEFVRDMDGVIKQENGEDVLDANGNPVYVEPPMSPIKLFAKYGTHVILDAYYGGRMEASYQGTYKSTTNEDKSSEIKKRTYFFTTKTDKDISSSQVVSTIDEDITVTGRTFGGTPISLGSFNTSDGTGWGDTFANWAQTVNGKQAVFIDSPNLLANENKNTGIWLYAKDKSRRDEVYKAYLEQLYSTSNSFAYDLNRIYSGMGNYVKEFGFIKDYSSNKNYLQNGLKSLSEIKDLVASKYPDIDRDRIQVYADPYHSGKALCFVDRPREIGGYRQNYYNSSSKTYTFNTLVDDPRDFCALYPYCIRTNVESEALRDIVSYVPLKWYTNSTYESNPDIKTVTDGNGKKTYYFNNTQADILGSINSYVGGSPKDRVGDIWRTNSTAAKNFVNSAKNDFFKEYKIEHNINKMYVGVSGQPDINTVADNSYIQSAKANWKVVPYIFNLNRNRYGITNASNQSNHRGWSVSGGTRFMIHELYGLNTGKPEPSVRNKIYGDSFLRELRRTQGKIENIVKKTFEWNSTLENTFNTGKYANSRDLALAILGHSDFCEYLNYYLQYYDYNLKNGNIGIFSPRTDSLEPNKYSASELAPLVEKGMVKKIASVSIPIAYCGGGDFIWHTIVYKAHYVLSGTWHTWQAWFTPYCFGGHRDEQFTGEEEKMAKSGKIGSESLGSNPDTPKTKMDHIDGDKDRFPILNYRNTVSDNSTGESLGSSGTDYKYSHMPMPPGYNTRLQPNIILTSTIMDHEGHNVQTDKIKPITEIAFDYVVPDGKGTVNKSTNNTNGGAWEKLEYPIAAGEWYLYPKGGFYDVIRMHYYYFWIWSRNTAMWFPQTNSDLQAACGPLVKYNLMPQDSNGGDIDWNKDDLKSRYYMIQHAYMVRDDIYLKFKR